MIQILKSLLKPYFLKLLEAKVALKWHFRKPGARHSLPHRLVVTLTSYPKRFDVLALTLKTLMDQTVQADATVLWIAEADAAALPADVRALEKHGLTIRTCADLRSYKKIIPALHEFGDAFLVTADDDVHYPPNWLETFCKAYKPGEKAALAYRAHRMVMNAGKLAPYDQWHFEITDQAPAKDVFFTGVGGVFYPPGLLHQDVTNEALFMKLCPVGDDIWLNWMVRLNGGTVRKVGPKQRFYEWPGSQGVALQNTNRGTDGGNDQQITRIVDAYGMPGF